MKKLSDLYHYEQIATETALALLDQVAKQGVDEERLRRAKAQMRAARVKSLQTSEDVAASMATDFMNCGDPHFSDRYVQHITRKGVRRATRYAPGPNANGKLPVPSPAGRPKRK